MMRKSDFYALRYMMLVLALGVAKYIESETPIYWWINIDFLLVIAVFVYDVFFGHNFFGGEDE